MPTTYFKTPLGIARITGDYDGISEIAIHDNGAVCENTPTELQLAVTELGAYFKGQRLQFTFQLNPVGTPFQLKVWKELLSIPFGQTISYLDLSKKLGDVKAIRAVASANGRNPLWIVIPCHRVIGSDGTLTGYAGGLWRKKWLIEHENPSRQQSLF